MLYIVMINFALFFFQMFGLPVFQTFAFDPAMIMRGQIWRLVTFLFIPPSTNTFFIIFVLYFYYMIGSTLENVWGTFRFNLFYFTGALGTVIASLLVYFVTGTGIRANAYYLNLSMFLAFAALFPNHEVLVFFILPVKIKWLAYLDIAYLAYAFITGSMASRILIAVSLVNIILFMGNRLIKTAHNKQRKRQYQKAFEPKVINNVAFHKCTVCGITEKDDPKMQFRYCSKCNGTYEYCMNHLDNHEHIQ